MEIVNLLVEHNANVEAKNFEKRTPLMMACEVASLECVQALVEHGATVGSVDAISSQSPLHYVCSGSGKGGIRVKIVKYLLEKGGDPNANDNVRLRIEL